MSVGAKAAIIIVGGSLILYLVLFLISVPAMSSSQAMVHAMGTNIYANMYKPLRDVLPRGYFVLELWQDYERHWCAEARSCEL